jgi:hypothetical protein
MHIAAFVAAWTFNNKPQLITTLQANSTSVGKISKKKHPWEIAKI